MKKAERGKVWLAVAGLVINEHGEWLVVKKKYGGLKGKWSLPAGFVDEGETADEAVIREVKEETGLTCRVDQLLGVRTGVIKHEISDNMIMFLLQQTVLEESIVIQENELYEAAFILPDQLLDENTASIMLAYMVEAMRSQERMNVDSIDPGQQFGYTSYKLFL
ncbi:NUDIX domain-containing protein [Robertmurraya beringensis]|uniref:NUDIX domain-containing protein n=1 Tax=Robertmurraya beringensis TaxID=641660 RepID=A0ABV6L2I8_9BACI|nr:Putative MutT/NUDIX-like protein [Mycobacteroides abscessus subsp. abscessus]